ncbi:ly6/PLAUR domain-containing protein 8 [Camelus ferus]|uniref:Ly6/PLAUR domain-containing protein 8 n=2 Tax=Camelus TaxID=9836 RepID=A0A8B8S2Z7_CAMFR|nr:ly6/PLAUR domain-containing protein 8 [Camelus ferus]
MKGFLVAGITALLTVAAVESLKCLQCNSRRNSCVNVNATECPANVSASCTSFLSTASVGGNFMFYQNSACSARNCSGLEAYTFSVHTANENFVFASQCCQGGPCGNVTVTGAPPLVNVSSNIECPACFELNRASCDGKPLRCNNGEMCVDLVAAWNETSKLVLKGCSNINDATCHILSTKKPKLGEFTLQKLVCADKSTTASTTKNPKTIAPHRPTSGTGSKVFFTPVALASLLLLGLLL